MESENAEAGASTRVAVVDMGTNSTRLLVADVAGESVGEIERRSTVTRLGRGVDSAGQLAAEAIEEVCDTVAGYISIYEDMGSSASPRSRRAPSATPPTHPRSRPSCASASR